MSFHIAQCHLLPLLQSSHSYQIERFFCQTYYTFHQHANSKAEKLPSQLRFLLQSINYNHKQRTLKLRNTQNELKSTNHKSQTTTFWTIRVKFCFLRGPIKMIDSSKKRNHHLAFELQNSHVCEKRSIKLNLMELDWTVRFN